MGGLAKRVPTTRSSLGFSMMASKKRGICSENTSMTSRGFCITHTQDTNSTPATHGPAPPYKLSTRYPSLPNMSKIW